MLEYLKATYGDVYEYHGHYVCFEYHENDKTEFILHLVSPDGEEICRKDSSYFLGGYDIPVFWFFCDAVYGDFIVLRGYTSPLVYILNTKKLYRLENYMENPHIHKVMLLHESLLFIKFIKSTELVDSIDREIQVINIVTGEPLVFDDKYVSFLDGFNGEFVGIKAPDDSFVDKNGDNCSPCYILNREGKKIDGPYYDLDSIFTEYEGFYMFSGKNGTIYDCPLHMNRNHEVLKTGKIQGSGNDGEGHFYIHIERADGSGIVDEFRYIPDTNEVLPF